MKQNNLTESVKVNKKVLKKVRAHVKKTKQSIGGFYDLAALEKLEKESEPKYSDFDFKNAPSTFTS